MITTEAPTILSSGMLRLKARNASTLAGMTAERIETAFVDSHVYRTYLADDSITCTARYGVVSLIGTVADAWHRILAETLAGSLQGVIRVESQLLTAFAVAHAAPGKGDTTDRWIARKLRIALLFHRGVNAHATTIEVKNGVVSLSGEAASAAQRELTGEYAKDLDGVLGVVNAMTVAVSATVPVRTVAEILDDASITAQVKTALHTHRSTNGLRTAVASHHGQVIVTGIAANAAEQSLVTKLVSGIHGVLKVKNRMVIA